MLLELHFGQPILQWITMPDQREGSFLSVALTLRRSSRSSLTWLPRWLNEKKSARSSTTVALCGIKFFYEHKTLQIQVVLNWFSDLKQRVPVP
jgi:hypothetical protein